MTPMALVGARVRTMDDLCTEVEAVAVAEGRIVAVGDRAAVLAAAGDGAEVVDVGGATVLPGFVDAHHHVGLSALYGGAVRLAPPRVTNIASLLAALAEASEALDPGRWLVVMEWDEGQLEERRPPTLAELDDAVPDRPLFALHYTCHRALANRRALALAGIDRRTTDPSGGVIGRDASGNPDGLLIERGMSRVEALARPDLVRHDLEGFLTRIAEHYRRLVAVGITRVCDTTVPLDMFPVYREAARRGDVLVPTLLCPVSTAGYLEEPWEVLDVDVRGLVTPPISVGPVKLVFDGAPGCAMCLGWWQSVGAMARTARIALATRSLDALRTMMSTEPRYGAQVRTGIAIYRKEQARAIVGALTERGHGVAVHAIGNAAIATALDAYDAAGSRLHGASTARIEHGAFLDRGLVRRIADAGVTIVAQPAMLAMPGYKHAASIPGMPFKPLRWLLDAGVRVAGSSDYPVTGFDPLDGVRAACARLNARGVVVDAEQRIELDEALAMYTRAAASACGAEREAGTIEVGKRADLVVVDGELPSPSARVRATVVGGAVVFGALAPG